jgi:hypothetical protein
VVLLADFTTIVCLKTQDLLMGICESVDNWSRNGGCATAVDLTLKGFDITLCSALLQITFSQS